MPPRNVPENHPAVRQAKAKGMIPPAPAQAADLAGLLAAVRAAGFPGPEPEFRFHPVRQWRFDWSWPPLLVAFEREGGDFRPVTCECGRRRTVFVSRHHSRDGLEADAIKYGTAAAMGWVVIRGTPGMIRDGRAAGLLIEALEARSGR